MIAAMKLRYCSCQLVMVLDVAEVMESSVIYKVDALTAIKTFQRISNLSPAAVISIYCKHIGLLAVKILSDMDEIDPSASYKREEMQDLLK